jgi:hypothetical protein
MSETEFRWTEVQREAEQPLNHLLKSIRQDVAKSPQQYPEEAWDRQQFFIRQFEIATDWVRLASQVYRDALMRLGYELSAQTAAVVWSNGLSGFIEYRIKGVLEDAFGVSSEDRGWLRDAPRSPSPGARSLTA